MSIEKSFLHVPRVITMQSTSILDAAANYVNQMYGDVKELLSPSQTTAEFVKELQAQGPQQDLEIGINAVQTSKRTLNEVIALTGLAHYTEHRGTAERAQRKLADVDVMRAIGYGYMKLAAVKAERNQVISDVEKRDIVFDAIDHGAVPHKKGYVTDDIQRSFASAYAKHDNIISLNRAG